MNLSIIYAGSVKALELGRSPDRVDTRTPEVDMLSKATEKLPPKQDSAPLPSPSSTEKKDGQKTPENGEKAGAEEQTPNNTAAKEETPKETGLGPYQEAADMMGYYR